MKLRETECIVASSCVSTSVGIKNHTVCQISHFQNDESFTVAFSTHFFFLVSLFSSERRLFIGFWPRTAQSVRKIHWNASLWRVLLVVWQIVDFVAFYVNPSVVCVRLPNIKRTAHFIRPANNVTNTLYSALIADHVQCVHGTFSLGAPKNKPILSCVFRKYRCNELFQVDT